MNCISPWAPAELVRLLRPCAVSSMPIPASNVQGILYLAAAATYTFLILAGMGSGGFANGVLFAAYHLHVPWVIIQTVLVDPFALAYALRRYRSALIGIIVHSAQSVLFIALTLSLVLQ
jgi:hypothetical protein